MMPVKLAFQANNRADFPQWTLKSKMKQPFSSQSCFGSVFYPSSRQANQNTAFSAVPFQGGHPWRVLTKAFFLWLCRCLVRKLKSHPKFPSLWWGLPFFHRKTICSECVLSRASRVSAQGCAFFFILALFYEWVSKAAAGRVTECMYMASGDPLLKRTALPVDSLWLIPSSLFPLTQNSTRVLLNSLWSHWVSLLRHLKLS